LPLSPEICEIRNESQIKTTLEAKKLKLFPEIALNFSAFSALSSNNDDKVENRRKEDVTYAEIEINTHFTL
jgi:hypothetical protein